MNISLLKEPGTYNNYQILAEIIQNPSYNPNILIDNFPAWIWILKNSNDTNLINYVLNNTNISLDNINKQNVLDIAKTKDSSIYNRLAPYLQGSWKKAILYKSIKGYERLIYDVAISDKYIVFTYNFEIKILKIENWEFVKTSEKHKTRVYSVAIFGKHVVSGSEDGVIKIWNIETGKRLLNLEGTPDNKSIAIYGEYIASIDDQSIKIWNLNTGKDLGNISTSDYHIFSVAISDKYIISAGTTIKVWDFNGKHVKTLQENEGTVTSVSISSNNIIVSGSEDTTIKVWNPETGQCLRTLEGHTDSISSVAIFNNIIVSGSYDKTVKIWDLETGECLKTLELGSDVYSVAIYDKYIVTGTDIKKVYDEEGNEVDTEIFHDDSIKVWTKN